MTIAELIEKLSKMDPNMQVGLYERGMEYDTYRAPYLKKERVVSVEQN